eukprot:INCI9870.12.p1 GENE.INCI9870.12~~INCI9870.12.p1  ORF type:complete len:1421 (+),score=224.65 INCI9870.12:241-4503(+)
MCSRFRFGLATVVLVGLAHGSPPPTATYMSLEDFYHGVHDESFNNILNLTSSSGSATWVPISEAVATGNVAPMRIALNYELAALDSNSTCSIAGQKMQLAGYDDTAVEATYTCTEADIATVEKLAVVQTYVSFMSSYIASLVSVPNVWTATPLTLAADSYGAAYTAGMASKMVAGITTTSYSGEFDVVVLVSMRPHSLGSESGLESYSSCLIRDQFRRCVVANINFCPAAVISNPSTSQQAAITARGYATAIHEMLHILNAVKPYGRFFINEDGSEPLDSDVCVQTGDVRRVKTPSVLAVAHQQFSCAELDGVAVEDSQYGLGIHWEATLAGPEIMSVGDWTGETYVSDLTCAFLEDTGYYTCDYSKLGSLTVGTTLEAALAENIFSTETRDAILKAFEDPFNSEEAIAAAEDEISRETLVTNRSVGYLRWGRNAGCQFLAGIPSEFGVPPAPAPAPSVQNQRLLRGVASLSYRRQLVQEHLPNATLWSRYLCEDAFPPEELVEAQTAIEHVSRFFDNIEIPVAPATGYCTSDNRMTATCGTVEVTDMDDNTVESHCEAPALNAALDSNESFWRCPKNSTQLPYYAAHDGARVVGINPALEYAPAFVGYQSCRNLNASQGFSITNGARAFLDAMTLFDGMDDDIIEGDGQAHCENCRCFKSSLAPSEDALELNFAPAGKCYVTNCYHDSYLQVGLVGEDGITWYKCPDGGGDLLVPGFSGSITCPDAETFCRQELITYVFMSETDSALQWVFWIGIVLAGVIVLVIIILIWKTIEKTCRACCGLPPLDMYDVDGDGDADWKEYFAMHKKPCTSQVLIVSNLVWILVGVVLIACAIDIRFFGSVVYPGVQKHVAPFTGLGLGLLIYGILGTIVACEGRPNFKTLSYFYCTMFSCFAVVFFAVGVYFLADPMQAEVGKYWNELRWYFPDNIQQANFSYAVELAQEFVDENFWIFGLVAIFIFLNLALSVVFAGLSIQSKIIVENFELVFNIGIGILAGVFIGFGLYYTVDVDQNVVAMLAILLVPLLFISVFGVIVFCIRNDSDPDKVYKCYIVYIVILVLTLVLAVAFAVVLFLLADDFPALVANNLTADQILAVINQWSSGDSWGIEELMVWGAGLMRLSASAVVVIVIMLLFVLGATAAILDFNKRRGDRAKVGNELELQKLRKGAFWERVTYVFNYLDAFLNGLGDGVVTVGELRSFFRGDDDLAGYFVKEIDGYARYRQDAWELTAADDGQITLDEWYSFVDYLGEKNKKHAEEGLELFERYMAADPKYDRVGRRKGPFWERCNAAFDAVDSGPVKGDGVLTFTELKNFFRGNEELSTYFISNIDLYSEEKKRKGSHDDSSDSSDDELEASLTAVPKGDGVITLAEWFVCARSFGRWSLVVYGLTGYLVGPGTLSLTFCWLKVKSRRCVLSQSLSST